ncbi:adenosine deaminase [Alternaria panax]|uniref:Adenosine deaminase n=1 Tax=Alternaria panax TaxID=48097 RepID=A0AAD4I6C7_9PLEO|nr:adenosine deaminase [Alternaria panax]
MTDVENALSVLERGELRHSLAATKDPYIDAIPKVELHIHIEGIISADLKWKFSQRNGQPIINPRTGQFFSSLTELRDSHDTLKPRTGNRMDNNEETLSFFEAYYGGFEALKTQQDYYDLAMDYYEHAAAMNVRYAEIFFDPQGHTRIGTSWETMMEGFREAQRKAEQDLNVKSAWIMCFLRDESPESAAEHYDAALRYRDMIVGIGLDSNEVDRPPSLFDGIFVRARNDGFRLTAHCDVGKPYPLEHIHQVASSIAGTGADRIDHGLNAAGDTDLMAIIKEKGVGMTICPWSYIRHQPMDEVFQRIRALFDAGIMIAIASDDPAFMEDTWALENLLVLKRYCNFTNLEIQRLAENSIEMCWASEDTKGHILRELYEIDPGI